MKTIKILLLMLAITAISCDGNDDIQNPSGTTLNGFTVVQNNGTSTFYETTNMYIEIDEDNDDAFPLAPDYYSFFFLNGRLLDSDQHTVVGGDEILLSTNTTNFAGLKVDVATHPDLQTGIPPTANNTYIASTDDSNIIHDFQVNSLVPAYFFTIDGTSYEFGNGDASVGTLHEPATLGHTVTINTINIDSTNPSSSTIDVDYTFVNTFGELISGHYDGSLGFIED
nr:hypothetical protein [Nonlabens ulvanivorans]